MTTALSEEVERLLAGMTVKTDREIREWSWKHEIKPRLRGTHLPERFWFRVEKWKSAQRETFEEVRSLLKNNGAIIALIGSRGVGKTTIAGQLIIERVMNESILPWHRIPPYRKLSDLLASFKPLYADFGSKDMDALLVRHDRLCKDHPLLVIDEIHVCEEQKIKNRFMIDTLDKRYANLVDTIIISNESELEFKANTDPSIQSRMREHGRILECSWESWR